VHPASHKLRRRLAKDPDATYDFYELRHFGASYMLNVLRIEPWVIARQLRHSNTKQILELYGHPETESAIDTMRGAWGENVRKLPRAWGEVGANRTPKDG
jgi:integrase